MTALEPRGAGRWTALADPGRSYVLCDNARHGVCNWLIREGGAALCESCRHNRIIPDLSQPENLVRWQKIELAKRYLFRSLLRWRLPMPDRIEDPQHGLVFDLLQDYTNPDGSPHKVLTGHDEGVITLNIVEADDAERENRRVRWARPIERCSAISAMKSDIITGIGWFATRAASTRVGPCSATKARITRKL